MATTVVPCVTCRGGSPPPPPPSTGTSLPTRLSNSLKLGPGSPAPGNKGRLIGRKPTRHRDLRRPVPLQVVNSPQQPTRVVEHVPERPVAVEAEQGTDPPVLVVVIDVSC